MRKTSEKIETEELCSYGCGFIAKFRNSSGNFMCSSSSNSCPENRKKNASGLKRAYSSGIRISAKEQYKLLSEETKNKMNWAKGLTKETNESLANASLKLKGRATFTGKTHSEETKRKISEFRTQWLKNPENRKNYGRGKKSWMELCFEKWLTENQFKNWEYDKHFWNEVGKKNYYADFCFEELKLIVELDGTQHLKSIEKDAIRDQYLNSIGYKVVRITHKQFKKRFFSDKGFFDILGR